MEARFRNMLIIVAVIAIAGVAFFYFQQPAQDNGAPVSFRGGVQKLNAIVEKNNVPIQRFREGKTFSLYENGSVENDFSSQNFVKLKNDLRSFDESIPASSAGISALKSTTGFYIRLVELNEQKKNIFDKIVSINSLEYGCSAMPAFRELLNAELAYETNSLEFLMDTADFYLENSELEGIELSLLSFESDLSTDDVTVLQEAVAVLEETC